MTKFTVHQEICANGRRWDLMISGSRQGSSSDLENRQNLFAKKSVRDAWTEMEKEFSVKTVSNLIDQISKFTYDGEDRIEYFKMSETEIEAWFYPKDFDALMQTNGLQDGILVTYTHNGLLEIPESYEF